MNLQISSDSIVKSDLTSLPNLAAIRERKRQTRINHSMRNALNKRFPLAFLGFEQMKVPLMLGIDKAILLIDPALRMSQVRGAIRDYVGGRTYLRNMIAGAQRIDLEGNPCGQFVTAEAADVALGQLKRLDALYGPSKYGVFDILNGEGNKNEDESARLPMAHID